MTGPDSVKQHVADTPVGPARQLSSPAVVHHARFSAHSHKFRLAVATLAALGVVSLAVALTLTVAGGARKASGPAWSEWRPQDSGLAGAQEIADFVSPYYRATPAYQLAVVTTMDLNNPSNPQVVVPSANSPGGVAALSSADTVAYNLCGLGSHDCSIGIGNPSMDRLLLLRREALELALYTFKYIPGVRNVVAILPPGRSSQPSCTGICPSPHTTTTNTSVALAVAFDRNQLQLWLEQPLRQTLPEPIPPTVTQMPNAPEAELVSIVTAHALFQQHIEQTQGGSNLIVLQPVSPQ